MNEVKIPYDNNGIFDGDTFFRMEFEAWCYTRGTFNKIKLRAWNINFLIERLKQYEKESQSKILYKQLSRNLLELHYLGKDWKD